MDFKKALPTIIPLLLLCVTALTPSIQGAIGTYAGAFFAGHPVTASLISVAIVALYHALPSPLQK